VREKLALVAPEERVARSRRAALARRLPDATLVPLSLDQFLSDRNAPDRVVLCPAGESVSEDLDFLRSARRRALWPPPGEDLAGAIAGLLGSHPLEPAGPLRPSRGRPSARTALLLEGDVTPARVRSAAGAGSPRHWIVERVQRVRLGQTDLEELRRLGIRWSALAPVEVVAIAATEALARSCPRWLNPATEIWTIPSRPKPRVRSPK